MKNIYSIFPISEHGKQIDDYFSQSDGKNNNIPVKNTLFICFTNRCGSTYLASILTELGIMGYPNEYNNFEYFNGGEVINICKNNNLTSFENYTEYTIEKYMKNNFFTTKISMDQLVWLTKKSFLRTSFKNARFIFIERKDVIAQAISLSIAIQTGLWTSIHKQQKKDIDLIFKFDDIKNYCMQITNANSKFELFFKLHSIVPLHVYYEDIVDNKKSFISKLSYFLELNLQDNTKNKHPIKKQGGKLNILWKKQFKEYYSNSIKV